MVEKREVRINDGGHRALRFRLPEPVSRARLAGSIACPVLSGEGVDLKRAAVYTCCRKLKDNNGVERTNS